MPIFDHTHPKIIDITFSFSEFALTCKKSAYSNNSFLRYSQFLGSATRLATPISDQAHPKIFWSAFNLCEIVSACKKTNKQTKKLRYFHWFVLEIRLIKKSCNLIDWGYSGPYLWKNLFPNMGFVQEHNK